MTDVWIKHVTDFGPQAVINPQISLEAYHEITRKQSIDIAELVAKFADKSQSVLDFGSGAGRFLPMLSALYGTAIGYEPCEIFFPFSPMTLNSKLPARQFDNVFCWLVLGDPDLDPQFVADQIAFVLRPGGTLILGEHCEVWKQRHYRWRFRAPKYYQDLFRLRGVNTETIGQIDQLGNSVTVFAGLKDQLSEDQ